jgi:hypothetical protein
MQFDLPLAILHALLLAVAFGAGSLYWMLHQARDVISEHHPRREPRPTEKAAYKNGGDDMRKRCT